LFKRILKSVSLDLKVSKQELRDFVAKNPDTTALFQFLNAHTSFNGHSSENVTEFVSFLEEQVGKNNFVRLTMEALS
jgi:hypothetical protein